jgi:hypothetical protein
VDVTGLCILITIPKLPYPSHWGEIVAIET